MNRALVTAVALLIFAACRPVPKGQVVLTNEPSTSQILRFETARMPPTEGTWRQVPRSDGEFVLSAVRSLREWQPKWDASGAPDYIVPSPNGPILRAVTKGGAHYDLMFTRGCEFVWVGTGLLEVPRSTSTQIVDRVEKALRK